MTLAVERKVLVDCACVVEIVVHPAPRNPQATVWHMCPLHKAAPQMQQALEAARGAIDILFAMLIERDRDFFPTRSGVPWAAMI